MFIPPDVLLIRGSSSSESVGVLVAKSESVSWKVLEGEAASYGQHVAVSGLQVQSPIASSAATDRGFDCEPTGAGVVRGGSG